VGDGCSTYFCKLVKSLYVKMEGGRVEGSLSEVEKVVFRKIWRTGAPSKVTTLVWKTLLDYIPTRVNLEIRQFCLRILV